MCIIYIFLGSADYNDAMQELKTFFPDGLCCKQTTDLAAEQVSTNYSLMITVVVVAGVVVVVIDIAVCFVNSFIFILIHFRHVAFNH